MTTDTADIPGPPGRRAGWFSKIVLLSTAISVSFGLGEIFTRLLLKTKIPLFPRYHTGAEYGEFKLRRLRPSTEFFHESVDGRWKFTTNAQGFRDTHDYARDKPKGVLRVLVLGDSHTQGFEVRQDRTYAEIIERSLAQHGMKAEVLNTGVSGFSNAEELAFFENEGLKYAPDVVVVGFFANDFEDNVKAGLFAIEGGALVVKKTTHQPGVRVLDVINSFFLLRWLSENSYFYSLGLNTAWSTAKSMLLSESEQAIATEYAIPTEEVGDYKRNLAAALFERLHAVCREHQILLIVLDIPSMDYGDRDKAFISSIPPDFADVLIKNTDALLMSNDVLGRYRGLTDLHLPYGHNHISEFSHLMFGLRVTDEIVRPKTSPNKGAPRTESGGPTSGQTESPIEDPSKGQDEGRSPPHEAH
ncbi:MAG: hypothetical protein IPK13_10750 [Deltaproteobacteria bacterium]|nr:hypothetical protein [Deltaproteobacteria bacterium]